MPLKFEAQLSGERNRWVLWEVVYLYQGGRDLWRGKHKDRERYRYVCICMYSYIRILLRGKEQQRDIERECERMSGKEGE